MIRKVELERFSVISSKPFDAVVAAIKASIGHPNMAELWQATQRATTAAELEAAIQPILGESGLMQFVEFDHGMIVRKGTEHHTSRIIRLVIGNPLIMKEMAKRVPDAGSYAPVTVLVDERADGVHISYDRMAHKHTTQPPMHLAHMASLSGVRLQAHLDRDSIGCRVSS